MTTQTQVFDGHNDVLLRLYKSKSSDAVSDFLEGEEAGHLDLKKARAGSFAGGLFALYSPSAAKPVATEKQTAGEQGEVALPAPLSLEEARKSVVGELAILLKIVRASRGDVAICKTTADVKSTIERQALGRGRSPRRRRSHRRRPEFPGSPLRGGLALIGAGLEPGQHIWPRCAVSISLKPGYRRRPDGRRRTACSGLQRDENSCRSIAHQREGILGCRASVDGAFGCDTLKRSCVMCFGQKSDRPATCRDPGIEGNGRLEFRIVLPSPGRQDELGHAPRLDGPSA